MSIKGHKIPRHILSNKENHISLININNIQNKFLFNSNKILNKIQIPMKTQNNNLIKDENNLDKSKIIQLNNDKYRNNNLFGRIKKLLSDFQKENDNKNRLFVFKNKKGNKKAKSKNNNNNKKNNNRKLSTLLVPQKKVYYIMPKVKNQMQLNHYLINDFKEDDSDQAYVGRSLKYQKMNEELDELVYLNQLKEAEKNGVSEYILNDYEKKNSDFLENSPNFGSFDFDMNSNDSNKNIHNKNDNNINEIKNRNVKKKNSIFNNNIYDLSLRRLYTENNQDLPKKTIINNNNSKKKNDFIFYRAKSKKWNN